ncbi:hypothetical protein GCM10007920_21340 [Ciceribacter naphthalenivorans]|uniref:Tail tape measure protein n=2 Tax=Alphaproteobacteria TaxID=28211 RepID=A0A512HG03_9HYPH|nr:hypothetical protein [Sphingomonas psychrolutea]GEO84384.1 hypothetical protein RNA01_13160 [Ciceribacter naphthalenivorans]GLR22347.1 hypothetical protein GCM10007920_21340 [Ciceribacter naphthalenivorans]GLT05203.1 hypothetical protein GCM10007926_21340 [Sphingomonas psychrolutea]
MTGEDTLALSLDLDAAEALKVLDDLEARSRSFGAALTSALKGATAGGKGLEDTLKSVGTRLADLALSAGLKPLERLLGNAMTGLISGLTTGFGAIMPFAAGGIPGRVTPFAAGGVVSAPTYFPLEGGPWPDGRGGRRGHRSLEAQLGRIARRGKQRFWHDPDQFPCDGQRRGKLCP